MKTHQMNKRDHIAEHKDKNDSDPHQKCFVTQNLPVKQRLCFCLSCCVGARGALADKPVKIQTKGEMLLRVHETCWPVQHE